MAIVMAAILFTMAHATLYHSIKIFSMGVLLGIIYHSTNNIYIVILAHMLNNCIFVLIMYFLKNNNLFLLDLLDNAIGKRSIGQVTLGIIIGMCRMFILLKKLIVVQPNIDTSPT